MKEKVVLITGSSLGIGKETALRFAKEGFIVVITYYKDKTEANRVANKCLLLGAEQTLVLELNVMNNKSIVNCVNKVIERFGKIDILINNAGAIIWKELKEQSFEDIELQTRTNLEGMIKMTRQCLPHVKEAIVNIASGAGKTAYEGLAAYCATKFGARGFTQSLSKEAPHLRVISVNPGMTATRMSNFSGTLPENVAEVIFNAAVGKVKPDPEKDIDVWNFT